MFFFLNFLSLSVPETCPANHECSAAAVCEPQGGNNYTCTCIQGYIDQVMNL